MKTLYLYLFVLSAAHKLASAMDGGEFHEITEVPYQAQIYNPQRVGDVYCGATIISEQWLVSAAHCVGIKDEYNVQVRIGSSSTLDKGKLIKVDKIIVPGDSDNHQGWESDICLLKTVTPIKFNEYQQPIQIARESPKMNDMITISGFGVAHYEIDVPTLKVGIMSVISLEECRKNFKYVTDKMFCTNVTDIDLCHGDSGSPAVLNGQLIGVASLGCGYGTPNVFTNVPNFYDWILKNTGIENKD